MEVKMADLYDDPAIREIQERIDCHANEIVALKGAIAALLTASDVSATHLAGYISEAARRPRRGGDAKSVPDTIEFFEEAINVTRGKRAP